MNKKIFLFGHRITVTPVPVKAASRINTRHPLKVHGCAHRDAVTTGMSLTADTVTYAKKCLGCTFAWAVQFPK